MVDSDKMKYLSETLATFSLYLKHPQFAYHEFIEQHRQIDPNSDVVNWTFEQYLEYLCDGIIVQTEEFKKRGISW